LNAPVPEPGAPGAESAAGSSWRRWRRVALPHIITAAIAVVISVAVQAALLRPAPPGILAPTSIPTAALPTSAPQPTTQPITAAPAPAPDIIRQDLADLRAEDDRMWAAIYLARAISQVSDAEAQMRSNDLANVAQSLVAVDGSLELAYERADESAKSPIEQLRHQAGAMRDDLYVRPEGMDARLVVLRQTILALIGARR
jgi:hypothetical protein